MLVLTIVVFVTLAFAIVILYSHSQFHISLFNFQGTRTNYVRSQIVFSVKITTETLLRKDRLFEASSSFQGICLFKVRLPRALKIEQHKAFSLADRIMILKNHVSIERR